MVTVDSVGRWTSSLFRGRIFQDTHDWFARYNRRGPTLVSSRPRATVTAFGILQHFVADVDLRQKNPCDRYDFIPLSDDETHKFCVRLWRCIILYQFTYEADEPGS